MTRITPVQVSLLQRRLLLIQSVCQPANRTIVTTSNVAGCSLLLTMRRSYSCTRMPSTSRTTSTNTSTSSTGTNSETNTFLKPLMEEQYGAPGKLLRDKINRGLAALGRPALDDDSSSSTSMEEDLSLLENAGFHSRGREATLDLCRMAEEANIIITTIPPVGGGEDSLHVVKKKKILDVGCGLGSTARFLARRYNDGVTIKGIDLTREYISVGTELTYKLRLGDTVELIHASALELPFNAESFDVTWTEHVQMNIADKDRFYSEIFRVLQHGGSLLFHDIIRGPLQEQARTTHPLEYPCPWAETEQMSWLATELEMQASMTAAGFTIAKWENHTDKTVQYFQKTRAKMEANGGPPPLGTHLLMGEDTAALKMKNHLRNLELGASNVVMGILKKPPNE